MGAILFAAMVMRLLPLAHYAVWGSDWGEYYSISNHLAAQGSLETHHLGWGRAYVDFPGLFVIAGGSAVVLGVPTADALSYVVPCLTSLSVLVVACVVLRLRRWPWAALLAAAILAVAFPEVFTNSHGVPGSIGSVLALSVMLVFLLGDSWGRETGRDLARPPALYALMLLLAAALAATHHLSLYFAIIGVGFAHIVRALLVVGSEPRREAWGEWSVIVLLGSATVFWLGLAPTFRQQVMVDMFGLPGWQVMAGACAGAVAMLLLARWLPSRRTTPPSIDLSGPTFLLRLVATFIVAGVAIMAAVGLWGVPGTTISTSPLIVPYFLPLVLALALTVGATELLLRQHGGHAVVAWIAAIALSFLLAAAIQSKVLVPYRHLPYIIEATAVLVGIGAFNLRRQALPAGRRWDRATGAAVLVLLGLLVLTAYPPKDIMGGFQEGTDSRELSAALWLRGGLPAPGAFPADESSGALVTDHRLSSVSFGVGGVEATWDFSAPVLHGVPGEDLTRALAAMETPRGTRPVAGVLLSQDLRSGAAGLQWEPARPIAGAEWDKFWAPPFVKLYDGGTAWVLGVVPQDA